MAFLNEAEGFAAKSTLEMRNWAKENNCREAAGTEKFLSPQTELREP